MTQDHFDDPEFEPEQHSADAEPEAVLLPTPDLARTRHRLLTREEEIDLARTIEEANRSLLEALARSPIALSELAAMLGELREGTLEAIDVLSTAADAEEAREQAANEILEAVRRVQSMRRRGSAPRRDPATKAYGHFVDTLYRHGLSPAAIDRILQRLSAERDAQPASGRKSIQAAISSISRSRLAAQRAKTTLVEANMGLVVWMATKRRHAGLPLQDLLQEGNMGLMRAAEKFDHRRGVRFNTYAAWWIRAAMNRALSDQSRTIRIPVHLLDTRHSVTRIAQKFSQERGRNPSERELADRTGVSAEKIRAVSSIPKEPVSMDAPLGADGDGRLGDLVANPDHAATPVDDISAKHIRSRVRHLLRDLTPREQEVLRLRFGIDRGDSITLQEIGHMFSLSRERIRQIEAEALSKLRERALAEELDSHFAS